MGFSKEFIKIVFSKKEDEYNRSIFVELEELIEISDEDLSYFGEGIFYCLPRNKIIEGNKDRIRKEYNLSKEMPKINGIYLPTFLKMRSWDRIRKTKPTLKEIIDMTKKESI